MSATAEADAVAAAQEIKDLAFTTLRTRYPFLKADALDSLVKSIQDSTVHGLEEQEQAMTDSKAKFDFFCIPPELRNRIYENLLVKTEDVDHQNKYRSRDEIAIQQIHKKWAHQLRNWRSHSRTIAWPALLGVNKQIRDEALPIYLGQNTFVANMELPHSPSQPLRHPIADWLSLLGHRQAKMLKSLILRFEHDERYELEEFAEAYFAREVTVTPGKVREMLRLMGVGVAEDAFRVQYLDYEFELMELTK